ncbi:hypothetical protein AAVH_17683 [Aphelenchoides avenae]|nr:hypothetical protein AAVH_17683 [Aphelenchus avenae]
MTDDFIDAMHQMYVSRLLLGMCDNISARSVIDFCFPVENEPDATRRRHISLELTETCPPIGRRFIRRLLKAARKSLHRNRVSLEVRNAGVQDVDGESFTIVRINGRRGPANSKLLDFTQEGVRTQIFQYHEHVYLPRADIDTTPASVFDKMNTQYGCCAF